MFLIISFQNNISILHVLYVDFLDPIFFSYSSIFLILISMLIITLVSSIFLLFIAIFVARCYGAIIRFILIFVAAVTVILVFCAGFIRFIILFFVTSLTSVISIVLISLDIVSFGRITSLMCLNQVLCFLVQCLVSSQ